MGGVELGVVFADDCGDVLREGTDVSVRIFEEEGFRRRNVGKEKLGSR